MPVKRRTSKAHRFTDFHRQMLLDGPETLLLAGCGYMEGRGVAIFAQLDEAGRAAVLADMRADWTARRVELLAEWRTANRQGEPWAASRLR